MRESVRLYRAWKKSQPEADEVIAGDDVESPTTTLEEAEEP
jgi:hypothetical protein